jgi:hypothetical protein
VTICQIQNAGSAGKQPARVAIRGVTSASLGRRVGQTNVLPSFFFAGLIATRKNPPSPLPQTNIDHDHRTSMTTFISPRTRYSRELKARLIAQLGGQCARCSAHEHLQFDCVRSQGGAHHEMQWRDRLRFYEREISRGNVQLLCPKCHVKKTLDEIAARHFHEARVQCPTCATVIRVSDQLRKQVIPEAVSTDKVTCDKCGRTLDDHNWSEGGITCRTPLPVVDNLFVAEGDQTPDLFDCRKASPNT